MSENSFSDVDPNDLKEQVEQFADKNYDDEEQLQLSTNYSIDLKKTCSKIAYDKGERLKKSEHTQQANIIYEIHVSGNNNNHIQEGNESKVEFQEVNRVQNFVDDYIENTKDLEREKYGVVSKFPTHNEPSFF